jgi:hypothetical protein
MFNIVGGSRTTPTDLTTMFRLFWRLFAATLIPCALALSVILAILQGQPQPLVQSGLALCDVPCWAGLEPGRTPAEIVPDLIQRHLNTEGTSQGYQSYNNYVVDMPARNVLGAVSSREGKVSTIRLNVTQPLEPMLMLLDAPRCVEWLERSADLRVMNIYWEVDGVYIMSNLALTDDNADLLTTTLNVWLPAADAERPCEKYGQMNRWPGYAALR